METENCLLERTSEKKKGKINLRRYIWRSDIAKVFQTGSDMKGKKDKTGQLCRMKLR